MDGGGGFRAVGAFDWSRLSKRKRLPAAGRSALEHSSAGTTGQGLDGSKAYTLNPFAGGGCLEV